MNQEAQELTPAEILVVDDSPTNLKLLTAILTERGYRVRPAAGGHLALKSAAFRLPDLILLDVKMPDMDGYEVCRALKADEKSRSIPVIFISALDEVADKVNGFRAGGVDYITRPFESMEVLARVETHLALWRLQKQLEAQNIQLQQEITVRKQGEEELRNHKAHLEELVDERTAELRKINEDLQREIIERKQVEEALKFSEARYRAIVEDQTELICRSLPDGTITFVNDAYCHYFGKKCEELVGQSFMPLIPDEDHEKLREHFASLSPENPVSTHEHRVLAPNGEIRWQQWTNRMILGEQHRIVEFQAVGRDTTDRKLMDEALQEGAEKIKLFAYSISHDLKSPAIGILGLTKLLHRRYKDMFDDRGKDCCEQILKASEQIAAFAEKINAFISAKEAPLSIESTRLKEILQMVRAEYSGKLDIRQVKWSEPKNLPEIRADRLGLVRILRNLVDNALKYGGEGLREIRIDYEESDDFHILFVIDDGVGIGKDHCEKIFRPFQRYGTSRGIEGTGLGLAIVKEIAEQHGGKVKAAPGPERGTTFCISISKHL